jgi:ZIP family zinc transporter
MFEQDAFFALALSFGAGMATLLGAVIVFVTNKKNEKVLTISLGFGAGVMICVSFTDLFPNAQAMLSQFAGARYGILLSVLFLIAGVLLAASLDRFVPHQGYDEDTGGKPHQNLFRVGFVSTLAIALHNFPEGIATFMAGYNDLSLGMAIAAAIAMHNIPEGISVAMPIYFATGSRGKAFKYTFLSGIAEPVGALLAFLVLRPFINDLVLGVIFSLVAGIMLYIALEELIPSSRQYGYNRHALIATFAGICIMPLSHII